MIQAVVQVFDTVERLITAAKNRPDIDRVDRYGPQPRGIIVAYLSGAKTFLWQSLEPCWPANWPDPMPDDRFPAQHTLRLIAHLLHNDPPAGWQWQPIAISGVHPGPAGLQIRTSDATMLIRAVSTSPAKEAA